MSVAAVDRVAVRAAAVADLFRTVERLLIAQPVVSRAEHADAWDAGSDRLLAQVAVHLGQARAGCP